MMNQQPDKFFREKLESYQKAAPTSAWDRIESQLEKPSNTFGWWKIAASLLLLTALGYLFRPHTSTSVKQPLAQAKSENQPVQETEQIEADRTVQSKDQPTPKGNQTSTLEHSPTTKTASKNNKQEKRITPASERVAAAEGEKHDQPVETTTPETSDVQVEPSITRTQQSHSLTLTFSVEETNKYLDKKALAQATSEEKKSSTFKKLLKKANDLKNNQDPFGDLREKKNEILALNFRNEKRGQNK
jgi:hypothetical protein